MSLLGNQLLLQRILRKPTSSGGGGALTANSVDSSHIINGSITAADLSNNISGISNLYAATILADELTVTDTLTVNNDLTTSNATITSLIVNGGSTLGSSGNNTSVGGELFANGDVYAQNNITVSNQLTASITSFIENNSDYLSTKSAQFTNFTTGTDKIHGTATLVGGTVTITHSAATANTKVLVTRNNVVNAANMGHLYVVKATGSFQIVSTNASDNNAVDWFFFLAN